MAKQTTAKQTAIVIKAPNFKTAVFRIIGTAPLVMCKFSAKVKAQMMADQEKGSQGKKGKAKEPKDFKAMYEASMHRDKAGWVGMPASAFRAAMISACRLCGFKMTIAKLSVFVEADGMDAEEGTPLVKVEGTPRQVEHAVRNANGSIDIHARAMFDTWAMKLRVRYDADQFSDIDLANLLMRAGMQVGIGEGRPDSRMSAGMGWGTFTLETPKK